MKIHFVSSSRRSSLTFLAVLVLIPGCLLFAQATPPIAQPRKYAGHVVTGDLVRNATVNMRDHVPQFGLIAEEVEKVNPALVVRDEDGKVDAVRYEAVNAMLLNEFLKEHRKNEEQEKTIAELKSGMTALAATVNEQAAQIQKVSAQLEASKRAPQVVNNP